MKIPGESWDNRDHWPHPVKKGDELPFISGDRFYQYVAPEIFIQVYKHHFRIFPDEKACFRQISADDSRIHCLLPLLIPYGCRLSGPGLGWDGQRSYVTEDKDNRCCLSPLYDDYNYLYVDKAVFQNLYHLPSRLDLFPIRKDRWNRFRFIVAPLFKQLERLNDVFFDLARIVFSCIPDHDGQVVALWRIGKMDPYIEEMIIKLEKLNPTWAMRMRTLLPTKISQWTKQYDEHSMALQCTSSNGALNQTEMPEFPDVNGELYSEIYRWLTDEGETIVGSCFNNNIAIDVVNSEKVIGDDKSSNSIDQHDNLILTAEELELFCNEKKLSRLALYIFSKYTENLDASWRAKDVIKHLHQNEDSIEWTTASLSNCKKCMMVFGANFQKYKLLAMEELPKFRRLAEELKGSAVSRSRNIYRK